MIKANDWLGAKDALTKRIVIGCSIMFCLGGIVMYVMIYKIKTPWY